MTKSVTVSCPHRLSVGGTWDLPALALPYAKMSPMTINMAINLRTIVTIENGNKIVICDNGIDNIYHHYDFTGKCGLIHAILAHFDLKDVKVSLEFEAPKKSGLGGSGVLCVALISAINEYLGYNLMPGEIIRLAHNIEDGMNFSLTGFQDQCAAVYGGINKFMWKFGSGLCWHSIKFDSIRSDYVIDIPKLNNRLILAYLGHSHNSNEINQLQIESFLSGDKKWFEILKLTKKFAITLQYYDWQKCIRLLNYETEIRNALVPERMTEKCYQMQKQAHDLGCSFTTAGAGGGGCVWSLCPDMQSRDKLKGAWGNCVIPIKIDTEGMKTDLY